MTEKSNKIYDILIFILSAFGVLLTFHLHTTQLDPICLIGEKNSCTNLISSLKLLGISNIYWGLFYYSSLVILSIIGIFISSKILIQLRNYSIIFGFFYSIFLVSYQIVENKFCFLCIISATICLLLFILLILSKFYKTHYTPNKGSLIPKLLILTTVVGLIVADHLINKPKFSGYHQIEMEKSVVLGNSSARITIVKWIDFQ
mgnify:CR=1 FL=1